MRFPFAKYSGCGNDFVIIDDRDLQFPHSQKGHIQQVCHRKFGVGADGVILLQESDNADFRMRIFNADGGEAEMCGNGIRALMKFIISLGFPKEQCSIATLAGILNASIVGESVTVAMGSPTGMQWNIAVQLPQGAFCVHFLNTGVPHVVLFTDELATFDVEGLGRQFRHHPRFAPQGTNFNVASIAADGMVWNRTYERGVEGETLACGTGCVAVAIAAHAIHGLPSPVRVLTQAQECLEIAFEGQGTHVHHVTMAGGADRIFEGSLHI